MRALKKYNAEITLWVPGVDCYHDTTTVIIDKESFCGNCMIANNTASVVQTGKND
jgi:hypothetical protein